MGYNGSCNVLFGTDFFLAGEVDIGDALRHCSLSHCFYDWRFGHFFELTVSAEVRTIIVDVHA